jgi:hypothetical protein
LGGILGERNPSRNFVGTNFGAFFFWKRNPSRKIAGRNFWGHFLGERNPPRKIAGKNVAEQEFQIMNVGWNMGIVLGGSPGS